MGYALRDDLLSQSAVAGAVGGAAGKASVFSGTGTFVYSMLHSEYLFAAIGALVAIATFIVNSYYRRRQHQLEERRFKLDEELKRMAEERKMMETKARIEALSKCSTSNFAPLVDTHF